MLRITFERGDGPLRVLALGAHADDIEIGCGGTLIRLAAEHPDAQVRWVVFSGAGARAREATGSAEAILARMPAAGVAVHAFRDGYFPFVGDRIKDAFEEVKAGFSPDLILTHRREDLHQDHRVIADLTWQTFRDHLILEYEIAKYEGDLGAPNAFVALSEETCRRKVEHVMEHFPSQRGRTWFTPDTLWSVLRLRGVECGSPTRYAEGFTCRKLLV
jgi:LmbE family N-acetylglucosaminyl deacetylase